MFVIKSYKDHVCGLDILFSYLKSIFHVYLTDFVILRHFDYYNFKEKKIRKKEQHSIPNG